ncbi:MAG: hypothetical protein BWY95_02092 [Bacteroidetes bacterium ADurb.BinA104]|nr:MAG: hypothetical protein BWY95_02092 [Bacteroidetes bacterium ADurb.BinA104]
MISGIRICWNTININVDFYFSRKNFNVHIPWIATFTHCDHANLRLNIINLACGKFCSAWIVITKRLEGHVAG